MEQRLLTERIGRLQKIAVGMDLIVRDVGPQLIRLAHLRQEARAIMEELKDAEGH